MVHTERKTVWSFLKTLKIELPYDPIIRVPIKYSKRIEIMNSKSYVFTRVHSRIIHYRQKVKKLKGPLRDEGIYKMWPIQTTNQYSVLKRKGILTHATTWINLQALR